MTDRYAIYQVHHHGDGPFTWVSEDQGNTWRVMTRDEQTAALRVWAEKLEADAPADPDLALKVARIYAGRDNEWNETYADIYGIPEEVKIEWAHEPFQDPDHNAGDLAR